MKAIEPMKQLVIQDNMLINARSKLVLNEKRLLMLAIYLARENERGLSNADNDFLVIEASVFAKQFNMTLQASYMALKEAVRQMFNRYVSWATINPATGKEVKLKTHWLDTIGYEDGSGAIHLRFHPNLVPMITRLSKEFTEIELNNISSLTSIYAIRLYELITQWRTLGKTPVFTLEELREKLGLDENQYSKMSNFKKNVLDFAIWQISKFTDIEIYNPDYPDYDYKIEDEEYQKSEDTTDDKDKKTKQNKIKKLRYVQKTKGRTVIGFQFHFRKNKKNQTGITIDGKVKESTIPPTQTLSDNELAIVMSQAETYIANKQKEGVTIDDKYRTNIIKQAKKQRWGLEAVTKQADDMNAQAKSVEIKIAEEKRQQEAEKAKRMQEQQEKERFIAHFEALPDNEQQRITQQVKQGVNGVIIKYFNDDNAYKNEMFRSQFKKLMSYSD